ncbi:MAG: carbonic anhydrase [Verrucomicrobia bacterium]|jgi:carbonic anhydrase|nr:MAG: carbonic anhydrase [Verrucomicrobiota bacterium]
MKQIFCVVILTLGVGCITANSSAAAGSEKLTRMLQVSTLSLLKEGNVRFVEGKSIHPNQEISRRAELAAAGQEPSATILACSDSREPVELIFDRGAGDLFVVRVEGNVAGLSELATMEYGVVHLGTPLLIVMGHSECGAVTAAVKGAELRGHLPSLISLIKPAAEKAKNRGTEEECVPRAIELNVWQQVENIFAKSALIREFAAAGKVQIVGAVYDIATGKVQWLGQHPEIDRLLADAKTETKSHEESEARVSNPQASEPVKSSAPANAEADVSQTPTHAEPAHAQAQYPSAHIEAVRAVKTEEAEAALGHAPIQTAAAHKASPH